jgi:hypothetical protein
MMNVRLIALVAMASTLMACSGTGGQCPPQGSAAEGPPAEVVVHVAPPPEQAQSGLQVEVAPPPPSDGDMPCGAQH